MYKTSLIFNQNCEVGSGNFELNANITPSEESNLMTISARIPARLDQPRLVGLH